MTRGKPMPENETRPATALVDALLASAQDAMWVINRELVFTHFNDVFSRVVTKSFGITPHLGVTFAALVDPERQPAAHDFWLDLFRRALSGQTVTAKGILGVPVIEGGSVTCAAFSARELTEEAAPDDMFERFSLIERKGLEWMLTFDAIELPIFITSMDGVIRRVNRAARDLAGRADYSDVLGRRAASLGLEEPWITIAQTIESVRDSEQPCNAQAYHAASDRSWDIAANWYRNPDDHAPRAIVLLRETTTLVRLQESVRRGEQLAALGELVAGVAHEVRNPLFGIELTVGALESSLPDNEEVADLLVVLRRWLDRLNRLMASLLAYGKTWSVDLKEGSLGDVLATALENVRRAADAANVVIIRQIEPDLSMLMDEPRLSQAFENLVTNAIQHSTDGQTITVSAQADGEMIACVIRDEGRGFAPADLPRVFEPFFTRRRGGTGLGLSIVQRIVDEHGGTVRAANAEGSGALISVRFPSFRS
jgi:signal transduction histidine kinase